MTLAVGVKMLADFDQFWAFLTADSAHEYLIGSTRLRIDSVVSSESIAWDPLKVHSDPFIFLLAYDCFTVAERRHLFGLL